jgi:hypothetical protein
MADLILSDRDLARRIGGVVPDDFAITRLEADLARLRVEVVTRHADTQGCNQRFFFAAINAMIKSGIPMAIAVRSFASEGRLRVLAGSGCTTRPTWRHRAVEPVLITLSVMAVFEDKAMNGPERQFMVRKKKAGWARRCDECDW